MNATMWTNTLLYFCIVILTNHVRCLLNVMWIKEEEVIQIIQLYQ